MTYTFEPIWFDRHDPIIIQGKAIEPGTIVTITKKNVDPRGWMVFITDNKGNFQSVSKNSLYKNR